MAFVLFALVAALLVPRPSAHGATADATTTLGPGFALASPEAGNGSASPAAGGASIVATGPGRPAPSPPAEASTPAPPHTEPVMVGAPPRRFPNLRRCDVGYSWIRGLCRRIFGNDSSDLAT